MVKSLVGFLCGTVVACAALAAAQDAAQSGAAFRARRDLQLLDVTVTAGREPVRGLTAADFSVKIDGRPAEVAGVEEVSVRPPTPASTAERSLLPDVVSNQLDTKRVVVLFIDDFSLLVSDDVSAGAIQQTRKIARQVANALGPDDLSAVVFTLTGWRTQTLTTSTPLLLNAIDRAPLFTSEHSGKGGADDGECPCGLCSLIELRQTAEALRSLAGLRKVIAYVGAGLQFKPPTDLICYPRQSEALDAALSAARQANVTIHAFDPRGFKPMPARGFVNPDAAVSRAFMDLRFDPRLDFLRNLASTTGGRAVINTNDPADQVDEVLEEGRSYYVVGVIAPAEDGRDSKRGRAPKIEVRVSRRGTKTSVRAGYRPPDAEAQLAAGSGTSDAEASLEALTAPLLPNAEVPMEVTASPFAGPDGQPVVSVVLGVLDDHLNRTAGQPLDLVVRVLDHRGQEVRMYRRQAIMPDAAGARYSFQSVIPLPPGRYELRVAARSAAFGEGSVYTHVDVPDFRDSDVSATNLMLIAPPAATPGSASGPVPVVPLTERTFSPGQQVLAFVRVYRRDASRPAPSASMQLVTSDGREVIARELRPTREQDDPARGLGLASDYAISLPLAGLDPDEYVMRVRIDAGRTPMERTLRFRVN